MKFLSYPTIYEGRENESAKVTQLKQEMKKLQRKNNEQAKKITELEKEKEEVTNKLVHLNLIIDNLEMEKKNEKK